MNDYSKRGNSYRHLERDPVLEVIRAEAERQGGTLNNKYFEKLSYESGISVSTLYSWFREDGTKRPQHLTVKFVLAALGCRMTITRSDGSEVRGGAKP